MKCSRLFASGATLLVIAASLTTLGGAATAAPGNPGTPSAPVELFHEDFEHGVNATPSLLTDYTSANGFTYTADPYYLDDAVCNGVIFAPDADDDQATGCSPNATYYNFARRFAEVLGGHQTPANTATNHALVNFTTSGDSAAGMVELETENSGSIDVQGKFLTFGIDVAEAYCNQPAGRSQLSFYLLDGVTAHPAQSAPLVACTDPSMTSTTVDGIPFSVGTVNSTGSVLFSGSEFGFRVVNDVAVGGGSGNDVAFDNLRVLDATPQLDKEFVTGQQPVAPLGSTNLVFTITNSTELAQKTGWEFTDALADGLEVSGPGTTTCDAATIVAPVGGQSIEVTDGSLGSGDVSCTVTVPVTSWEGGAFKNGPGDVTTVGLVEPGTTEVSYQEPDPGMTIAKSAELDDTNDNDLADVGEQITYSFEVENTGNVELTDVRIDDPKVTGLDPASADLAPGDVVTFTADPYIVTQKDLVDGSVDNTATATGSLARGGDFASDPDTVHTPGVKPVGGDDSSGLPDAGSPLGLGFLLAALGSVALGAAVLKLRRRPAAD